MTSSDKWEARFRGSDWRKARDTTANSPPEYQTGRHGQVHIRLGTAAFILAKTGNSSKEATS